MFGNLGPSSGLLRSFYVKVGVFYCTLADFKLGINGVVKIDRLFYSDICGQGYDPLLHQKVLVFTPSFREHYINVPGEFKRHI